MEPSKRDSEQTTTKMWAVMGERSPEGGVPEKEWSTEVRREGARVGEEGALGRGAQSRPRLTLATTSVGRKDLDRFGRHPRWPRTKNGEKKNKRTSGFEN